MARRALFGTKNSDDERYAIVRTNVYGARPGTVYYQARDVGSVTTRISSAWTTHSKEAAERLADEVGGHVITVSKRSNR